MNDQRATQRLSARSLLREPVVHFFILGALLFALSHVRGADSRRIVVPKGVPADLARRFQDDQGRAPNPTEQADALIAWKRDEALYREALRKNLHLNDTLIRGVLIDKMRAQATLGLTAPVPSDANLEEWLQEHAEKYTLPQRYDFQFLGFSRSDADVEAQVSKALRALTAGEKPSALGRPLRAGNLTQEDLSSRLPPTLALNVLRQPPGAWERVEGEQDVWLLRVRGVSGGLPKLEQVRARVTSDWTTAAQEADVQRELQKTVDLYEFQEAAGEK